MTAGEWGGPASANSPDRGHCQQRQAEHRISTSSRQRAMAGGPVIFRDSAETARAKVRLRPPLVCMAVDRVLRGNPDEALSCATPCRPSLLRWEADHG